MFWGSQIILEHSKNNMIYKNPVLDGWASNALVVCACTLNGVKIVTNGQGDSRRRMIERKYVCNNSEKMSLGRRTRSGNLTMYHPPVAPRRCQPPPTQQRNLSFLEARISHIWLLSPLQLNKKDRQKTEKIDMPLQIWICGYKLWKRSYVRQSEK